MVVQELVTGEKLFESRTWRIRRALACNVNMLHFSTAFHSQFCTAFSCGIFCSACPLVAPEHCASFQICHGAAHIAIMPAWAVPPGGSICGCAQFDLPLEILWQSLLWIAMSDG